MQFSAAGGDLVPERQVLGQIFELGAIAGLGLAAPVVDHADVSDASLVRPRDCAVAVVDTCSKRCRQR